MTTAVILIVVIAVLAAFQRLTRPLPPPLPTPKVGGKYRVLSDATVSGTRIVVVTMVFADGYVVVRSRKTGESIVVPVGALLPV